MLRRLSTVLSRRFASLNMPRVPATSKKARSVLASEPLVPASIKDVRNAVAADAETAHSRRSLRISNLQALPHTLIKDEPVSIKKEDAETHFEVVTAKPNSQKRRPRTKVSSSHAEPVLSPETDPVSLKVKDEQFPVGKRNEMADGLGQDVASAAEKQPARKRQKKSTGKAATAGKAATELEGGGGPGEHAIAKKKTRRAKVSAKKEEAVGPEKEDLAESKAEDAGGEESKSKKRKKNRRGPAGFALRGENVEDTPAARRARLKAAMQAGDNSEEAQQPEVLESEVLQMCKDLGNDRLGQTAPWTRAGQIIGGLNWWTGCHCSTSGGLERAVINAAATGCRAFAMDVRCKMRWESPPLTDETVIAFKAACEKFGYAPEQILPHGSYLINLASPDPEMAKKGYGGFLTELQRCERLGLKLYNFHPGSTTGLCTHEESMDRIAGFINNAHKATKGVTIVLENMSSVGNIVGGKMWHLRYIIDRVQDKQRIGFCIDTCHLFSSGVDLRTEDECEAAFKHIDEVIGLQYLRGLHVNDSKTPFDSHRDRHENIGRGSIPMTAFQWIMNNPIFQGIPLIMETPVQEREAPVNYRKSLEHGKIWWKDPSGPYGVGTDRRDIILLNSLVKEPHWS